MTVLLANLSNSHDAWFLEYRVLCAALIGIGAVAVTALAFRSCKVGAIALLLVSLYSLLIQPWRFLWPVALNLDSDPWGLWLQRLGVGWVIVAVISVASLAIGLACHSPKRGTSERTNDT
jgi:hypothetical protein